MSKHEKLVEAAKHAIDMIYWDLSATDTQVKESLEELMGMLEVLIHAPNKKPAMESYPLIHDGPNGKT